MQPVWLCIVSSRAFEDSFENAQWRKVKLHTREKHVCTMYRNKFYCEQHENALEKLWWLTLTEKNYVPTMLYFLLHCAWSRAFSTDPFWSNSGHNWHKLEPIYCFSPHSGDHVLVQVWSWSGYLSTYFADTFCIFWTNSRTMYQYLAKRS